MVPNCSGAFSAGFGSPDTFPQADCGAGFSTCPNQDEILESMLALLPRGRAWQTHENGPTPGGVLHRFWRSAAEVFGFLNKRLCDLRQEFFCHLADETVPEWLEEYGLPDECDPYPDLCAKIAAQGGARCEDYVEFARNAGWDIECVDDYGACGAAAGCFPVGCGQVGGPAATAVLNIRVFQNTSPAYTSNANGFAIGCGVAGQSLSCPADITPLICILNRVIHAHIQVNYIIGIRTVTMDAPITMDSDQTMDGRSF